MNFIFDLYGTLIDIWTDEENPELWEYVSSLLGDGEENGESVRREYLTLCKGAKRDDSHEIDLLSIFIKMLKRRGVDISVASSLAEEFRRMSMVRLSVFNGAIDVLSAIKEAGCGVYLLSNAQSCFTITELKLTGLYQMFDDILISSDVGVKKPYKEIFNIAFEKFGVNADNSIYVGNDLRDDVLGATGVGMKTVYIETAQSGRYDNDMPKPTYIVNDHREMRDLLLSLAKA